MADKCLAKPSRSPLQLTILGDCMRTINYDSATVNISVLLNKETFHFRVGEQRFIIIP